MCMPMKVQSGCVHKQLLESIRSLRLQCVTFIFVPGHVGVKGNDRANGLARNAPVVKGRAIALIFLVY